MLVTLEKDGPAATITLADTERRNALSAALVAELMSACDDAENDPRIRIIVVTNQGSTFCAGADLKERTAQPPAAVASPPRLFGRYARSPKPYVGRIAGHCVAGGMGLASAFDISIAASTATFGFSEVRLGVVPAVISVVCLPKMRPADARSTILRGNRFSAERAVSMGLIAEAVTPDVLDQRVGEVVTDLLSAAPAALATAKQLLGELPDLPEERAFAWTAQLSAEMFASADGQEGMTAFLERRDPAWKDTWHGPRGADIAPEPPASGAASRAASTTRATPNPP